MLLTFSTYKLQKTFDKEETEEREKDVGVYSVPHEDSTNKEPLGGIHKLFNLVDRTVHCKSERGHECGRALFAHVVYGKSF